MFFVRTATARDIEPVRRLLSETWHATYDSIYGTEKVREVVTAWQSPESLKARLAQPEGEFLVADDGKSIGGMGFAAMSKDMAKTAFLYQLYVHPDVQRQGIGRDIFAEIETCFPDAEKLRLEVDAANSGALSFYAAHGLVEVDRFVRHEGLLEGFEVVVMEKSLG